MNEIQEKVWNIMTEMTAEQAMTIMTNVFGNRILDDEDLLNELKLNGYIEDDEQT